MRFPFSLNRLTKTQGAWLSALLMTGLIVYYFMPVVFQPLEYWMVIGGDATKNYFVPAYYAKYDDGLRFTGMNYPYDEHIIFADGNFPISWVMQRLQRVGLNVADYTVPVINYAMLLSLVVSAVFLFLLLYERGVGVGVAVAMAVGISLLSPQLQRFLGHFSLGYTCYLPIMFYLLHRVVSDPTPWGWLGAAIVAGVFFGMLHSYFVAIGAAFLLSFALVYLLMRRWQPDFHWRQLVAMAVMALAPIVILQVFVLLTDSMAHERVHVPWGFDHYFATWESVFLPPVWNHFNFFAQQPNHEGYGYIGVVAWFGLVTTALVLAIRVLSNHRDAMPRVDAFFVTAVLAAFVVLLYAMQYPWRWNLRWLADELPLVGQFRSLGRFTWPFYYAAGFLAAQMFYTVSRQPWLLRRPWLRSGLLITLSALLFFDAQSNVKPVKRYYEMSRVAKQYWPNDELNNIIEQGGYNVHDFQAVIELPFQHIGTEKFWIEGRHSSEIALRLAYNSGLRMINCQMARSPIYQSANVIQLTGSTLIEKTLVDTLVNAGKPLLLIVSDQRLRPTEQAIVDKATLFARHGELSFLVLDPAALRTAFEPIRGLFESTRATLKPAGELYAPDENDVLRFERFSTSAYDFLNEGQYVDSGRVVLFASRLRLPLDSAGLAMSCWFRIRPHIYGFPEVHIRYFNTDGVPIEHWGTSTHQTQNIYRDWARFDFVLPQREVDSIHIFTVGRKYELARFQLQRNGSHVFGNISDDGSFVYNNFFIPPAQRATDN